MAGRYAKLSRAIWDNEEFLELSPLARLTFIALFSQKKISMCGTLDYMPRRWERAVGCSSDQLAQILGELTEANYVLIDEAAGELVVRSYVAHDVQVTNRKMVAAVWTAWESMESALLRRQMLDHFPSECWENAPGSAIKMRSDRRCDPPGSPILVEDPVSGRIADAIGDPTLNRKHNPETEPAAAAAKPTDAAAARPVTVVDEAVAIVMDRTGATERIAAADNPGAYRRTIYEETRVQVEALIAEGAEELDGPQLADLIVPPTELHSLAIDRCEPCSGRGFIGVDEDGFAISCPTCSPQPAPQENP